MTEKEKFVVFMDVKYYPYVEVITEDFEIAKRTYDEEKIRPREGKYLAKIIEMEVRKN